MRRSSNIAVATTLTSAIDATQTTIPLAAVTGWVVPGAGDSSLAQIDAEMIEYTGVSGLTFTGCTRGVDGTTAAAHASGAAVAHVGSAADLEAIQTKAPLDSPALTGTPTAPTAAPGTSTTQIATTAFVGAAVTAGGGSTSPATSTARGAVKVNSDDSGGDPVVYRKQEVDASFLTFAGAYRQRFRSGLYYSTPHTTNAAGTANQNALRLTPLPVAKTTEMVRIAVEVTSVAAGSVIRLGVYGDDGSGFPGALILEAGTIDGSVSGFAEITIALTLPPETYWIGGMAEGGSPAVRQISGQGLMMPVATSGNTTYAGWNAPGQTPGSLPSTYPTDAVPVGAPVKAMLKVA